MTLSKVAVLATLIVVLACSGDDDDESSRPRSTNDDSVVTTTVASAATGETQAAAFESVKQVVHEATGIVDQLFQNPEAVTDSDNEDVARLRELYVDGSSTPDGVMAQLEELAAADKRVRPTNDFVRDLGVYQMVAPDENTVRFRVCTVEDHQTVDAAGNVVEVKAQVTQGDGEARRVDGEWRLQGIQPRDDLTLPFESGTAEPGFCDYAYGEEGRV